MDTAENSNFYDVIVIGAGISGSVAAYELSKQKLSVLLLEKEKLPRYKACGGGITYNALKLIPVNIDSVINKKCYEIDIYFHDSSQKFKVKKDYPIINMVMRSELDYRIVTEARNEGAEIRDCETVIDIIDGKEFAEVITNTGIYKADYVIGADGIFGLSHKKYFKGKKTQKIPAIECELYIEKEKYHHLFNAPRFDFGDNQKGYCWSFPKTDHLSIGIAEADGSVNLNEELKKYFETLGINSEDIIRQKKYGHAIPVNPQISKPVHKRILLVGDALGLADPSTAEGISNSVLSAKIAAESIILFSHDYNLVSANFYRHLKRRILKNLAYSRILYFIVYKTPKIRKRLLLFFDFHIVEYMTNNITKETNFIKELFGYRNQVFTQRKTES